MDIAVTAHQPVDEIVLNANRLTDIAATVRTADGTTIEVSAVTLDAEAERLHLRLAGELPAGAHSIRITFRAQMRDDMEGMYRSTYRDDAGEEQVVITSHFEATAARRSFPCWDEPDLKASFALTLVVPDGLIALTNTPEIHREPRNRLHLVRFAPSMIMSTYLVCVVVGRLATTPATTPRRAGRRRVPTRSDYRWGLCE